MESIFVLKNVTSTTVTAPENLNNIAAGELVVIGDNKVVLTGTAGELQDIKYVQFFTKKDDGSVLASVPVLRRSMELVTHQIYTAPVLGVYRIGSESASVLPFPTEGGELNMIIENLSYNHAIASDRRFIDARITPGETKLAFYTRVVGMMNNNNPSHRTGLRKPFYTAVVSGTGNNIAITITTANTNVTFSMSMGGILTGIPLQVITPQKPGIGVGADVLAMEKDFSRNLGNNNYMELTDLWYSGSFDTVPAGTYSLINLQFGGINDSPTAKRYGARNNMTFAYPSAATALATKLSTLFGAIFGDAWTGAEPLNNAEPGSFLPDNNAFDGVVTIGDDGTP